MMLITSKFMFDSDNVLYFKESVDEEKPWRNGVEVHFKNTDEVPLLIHGMNLHDIVLQMRNGRGDT